MRRTAALAIACVVGVVNAAYDEKLATKALYYSGAAYCRKDTIYDWTCGEPCSSLPGAGNVFKVENELLDTFGFVTYNAVDDQIVVAFRGTNGADFLNWMTNLVYYRVQYEDVPNTQVHSGFYTAYSAVQSQVRSALSNLIALHPTSQILVTGHSLGGALGTFAMLDIKRNLKFSNPIKFYSFGSPRVGNQAFTDYFMSMFPAETYQRVTHYTDVIVQVPPRQMSFNHAGTEVWYYNDAFDGLRKVCTNYIGYVESGWCADSYLFTTGIDAHLNYLGKPISRMCTIKGEREFEPVI
jgi:hypothetical protein